LDQIYPRHLVAEGLGDVVDEVPLGTSIVSHLLASVRDWSWQRLSAFLSSHGSASRP
jgi:hypothetical protein